MLTKSVMRQMWPRAQLSKIEAIVRVAPRVFNEYGIRTDLELAHLMAQVSHENGAGTISRENMSYTTVARLMQIFGVGRHSAAVTEAEAPGLLRNAPALAERVYGLGNPKKARELGNIRKGDGYCFRGGGDLQLTGGANYKRIGELTGFDLYGHPELLDDPAKAFEVSCAEFVKLNCLPPARQDNILTVTKRVNGGTNGLAERKVWLRKWKAALAADDAEESAAVIEAPVPPPPEPRGGESDQPAPMVQSNIGNGAIAAGSTAAGGGGLLVADRVLDRVVDKVGDGADKVVDVAARSAVSWPLIFGCILVVAAIGFCGFIWWKRYRLKQDAGV